VLAAISCNVLLYAAIDGWRRQMVQRGTQLIGDALALTIRTREAIEHLDGLHVLKEELLAEEASHDLDPMHVLIDRAVPSLGNGWGFESLQGHRVTSRDMGSR
jgi:arginine decarboxylase